jgi:hypothetical protein
VRLLQPGQRIAVDESGMIRTQMKSTVDQKMVVVAWDALYDIPCNSNQNSRYIKANAVIKTCHKWKTADT